MWTDHSNPQNFILVIFIPRMIPMSKSCFEIEMTLSKVPNRWLAQSRSENANII